jgi:3'(2'), 5'-bisphosphate nucleotidase
MTEYARELAVAVELARKAGVAIMKVYATDFSVAYKGKNDPVTDADKRGNELIVKGLKQAFPNDIIVAEESAKPDATQTGNRIWYVDPVDGTKEFIAKNGEFSVMIGLAVNGQAKVGVVFRPDEDLLYAGVVGQGAWMEVKGKRTSLAVTKPDPYSSITLTVSRSHRNPLLEKIGQAIGVGKEVPSGSVGLKIGLIACGIADVYLEPGPYTKLWDSCGPEAILRAAGGQFTNALGEQLRYGLTQLKNTHGLVATNGVYHEKVIKGLKPVAKELGLTAQPAQ